MPQCLSPLLSRRELLGLLGGAVFAAPSSAAPAPMDAFTAHAEALGRAVLRSGQVPADARVLGLSLRHRLGDDLGPVERCGRAMGRAACEDFARGDTLLVDGVLLGRTEAEAFACLALS